MVKNLICATFFSVSIYGNTNNLTESAHCPPVIFIWRHSRRPVNSHLISLKCYRIYLLVEKCINLYRSCFGDISNYCTERNPWTKLQKISYHGAVDGPWRLESIGWCQTKNQSLSHLVCFPLIRKKMFIALFSTKTHHAFRVYGYFVITKNNLASFSLEIVD